MPENIELKILKNDSGHTVIEMLLACIIMLLIMTIGARVWTTFIHANPGKCLSLAQQIAHNRMETVLANQKWKDCRENLELNERIWTIEQRVEIERDLINVFIQVKPYTDSKWIFTLYTEYSRIRQDIHLSRQWSP